MRKILVSIVLLLSCLQAAQAEKVSWEQAEEAAVAFFRSARHAGISPVSAPSLRIVRCSSSVPAGLPSEDAAFYVFNNTSGPGFVIVSGDDAVAPVLGYSFENNFPEGRPLPPNLSAWLEGTAKGIIALRKSGAEPSEAVRAAWKTSGPGTPVKVLETALWDQSDPYNRLCPEVNGALSLTGCTATALAIVMRYHKWPERGTGILPGYTTVSYGALVDEVKLGHAYDWDNMSMRYHDDQGQPLFNEAEAEAVAVLMRDCGVLMKSDFTAEGTGAYTNDILVPLVENMGYSSSLQYVFKDRYEPEAWTDLMKSEIDGGRPILYGGYTTDWAGHSFVLDGYDSEGFFRVNWGWGGMSNGYFDIDVLDPYEQGAGGADAGFSVGQDAIIGIEPREPSPFEDKLVYVEAEGEDENGAPYVYGGLSVKVDEIDQEIPFTVYMGKVMNIGDVAVEGLEVMLALVDGKGRIAEELSIYKVPEPVQPQSGFTYFADVTIKTIIDGDRIRGYFRAGEEEEWTVIKNSLDNDCAWELLLDDYYPKTLLDENTSVTYNKTENRLTVNTLAGTEVTLVSGVDGSNLTVVPAVDGEVSVDLSEYGVNVFVLQLRKGRQKVEVSLEF